MQRGKVEITGVDTASLPALDDTAKRVLLAAARAGDKQAREELVLGNLRLVLSVIRRFPAKNESADDLFQVGCIGLVKAIDRFDPSFDVKFSTYAVPMIIGEIRRYLRDNNAVRVSRGMRDLAYRALGVREEISAAEGRDATAAEIAEKLSLPLADVSRALEATVEPMSLYDSVYGDGDDAAYVIDGLSDETESDAVLVENISLRDALSHLAARERDIVDRRFFRGKTQMEIASEIGISQAQVSRVEKSAIEKMRKFMM